MYDDSQLPFSIMTIMAMCAIGFVIALIPTIFFFLTMQRALSRCAASSRTMTPGQVWLGLIPIFNLVWPFFLVSALSDSLHHEFTRRGIVEEPQPGRTLGLAYAILGLLSAVPFVGFLTGIPALVCWILYWVKIADLSGKIARPWAEGATVAPAGA